MYQGDYTQERITLKKELDRKRIEDEKAEIILYNAEYEFLNSWNKDVRETRVIKTIYDNGHIIHGVYNGVDLDDKAPDNLKNINSSNDFDAFYNGFWCAESEVPTDANITPCEIYIGNECVNEQALNEWTKNYDNLIMLEKELKIKFYADIDGKDIMTVERGFRKCGVNIIVDNFPELSNIGNFNIKVLGASKIEDKKEIEVTFYANVDKNNFLSVKRGFQKYGAEIIADNFPELDNIGSFKIIESKQEKNLKELIADMIKPEIKEQDFFAAYMCVRNKGDFDELDFMKAVVKEHGTNGDILQKAVQAVSNIKDQSPAFMSKLLNDTLKTDEYNIALNKGQEKNRSIER